MSAPEPMSTSVPETIKQLGECAYTAFAKELYRNTGIESPNWNKLRFEHMRGWHQAANNVVARVAAFGYPRPLDAVEDAVEARRCAEWLMYVSDGGDAGSEVRTRLLLRTSARLLAHHASRADSENTVANAFRDCLAEHPYGERLTGREKDELALGLARIALDFQAKGGAA